MKVKLPELEFTSYLLLMRALQYYRNSSAEFTIDGDVIVDIYVLITKIEEKLQIVRN